MANQVVGDFFEFLKKLSVDPCQKAEICRSVAEIIEGTRMSDVNNLIQDIKRQGIRFELQG